MRQKKSICFSPVFGFENESKTFLVVGRKSNSEIRDMTNEFTISLPQTEEVGLKVMATAKISNKFS